MASKWVASLRRLLARVDHQTQGHAPQKAPLAGELAAKVLVRRLIREGNGWLEAGNIDQALASYGDALFYDGSSADAMYGLGIARWRRDVAEAELWASLALLSDRSHVPATKLLSSALFAQGERAHAWSLLTRAGRTADRSVELQLTSTYSAQWGFLNEAIGYYGRAELYLRDALWYDLVYATRYAMVGIYRFDPFLADIHHAIARVLQRQSRPEEARMHYQLAQRIDLTIALDPMHREIMPSAELDKHVAATSTERAPAAASP